MSNLTTVSTHLPANIEDLAKFVLVGREKLVSVRAEIRAIDKLSIAEDVRKQKRDEAQMLSEALLDAEVRIGELLKQIPKDKRFRGNQWQSDSGVVQPKQPCEQCKSAHTWCDDCCKQCVDQCNSAQQCRKLQPQRTTNFKNDTAVAFEKPKLEVVQELGFTPKQKERFETLAANKDVVEQVKAEARENEDIPTRSRVLQLVKEKNKPAPVTQVDPDFAYHSTRAINDAIGKASTLNVDEERLVCWANSLRDDAEKDFQIMMIDDAIAKLRIAKAFLTKSKAR